MREKMQIKEENGPKITTYYREMGCTTCEHGAKATYQDPCHLCFKKAGPGKLYTQWQPHKIYARSRS